MASSYSLAFLGTLIVLQIMSCTSDFLPPLPSDFLSPLLSPVYDNVCNEYVCGKGTCKPSRNSTFFFECECEAGWKQTRPDHDDDLKFLPCVIPNCTLNSTCTEAAPPVQDKESRNNESSIFDPCNWTNCGGGTCNKTSPFTHKCECREGYYNLLNITAFPCYRDCALGMDCSALGISVMNKTTPSSPSSSDNGKNQAISTHINWLVIFGLSLVSFLGR